MLRSLLSLLFAISIDWSRKTNICRKYWSLFHFMMSIVMIPQTTRSRTKFQASWTGVTTQIHMFAVKEGLI